MNTNNSFNWSSFFLGIALVAVAGFLFGYFPALDEALAAKPAAEEVTAVSDLTHLAYWTSATEEQNWPDMAQFNIVACHGDPDSSGNAKIVFLIGKISEKDLLQLTYYNGYTGTWDDTVKEQIIKEVQDSVRPHVPGFTISEIEIIHIK